MKKIMYEVNWHWETVKEHPETDMFTACTISKIEVIREGILEGCSADSITAIGADGRRFNSVAENYFNSEAEAWQSTKTELMENIAQLEKSIAEDGEQIKRIKKFIKSRDGLSLLSIRGRA